MIVPQQERRIRNAALAAAALVPQEPHEAMVARVEREISAIMDNGIRVNPLVQVIMPRSYVVQKKARQICLTHTTHEP